MNNQTIQSTIETLEYTKRVIGDENQVINKPIDEEIQALRQALEQPEQEPVAWMSDHDVDFKKSSFGTYPCVPLYTAPPKREWKSLTSDDKHFLLANAWNKEQAFDGFMDAIDKFLKEKNT